MSTHRNLILFIMVGLAVILPAPAQTVYPYAINTVAGTSALGDGGPATAALLEFPQAVVADGAGNIYIGDTGNRRVRVVNAGGIINTFADIFVANMKVDPAGNIYATDGLSQIYKILPDGNTEVFAGSGNVGYTGDGGPAISATFDGPNGVAVDALGDVFVADTYNNVVREITTDGKIHTIAGTGVPGYGNDQIPGTQSPLAYPYGVEVDAAGNIYISEEFRIRKMANGIVTTIAGYGISPVDGPAINTAIGELVALAVDKASNLYLADEGYNLVRMIAPSGNISTLAGSQLPGFGGDGSYGSRALLNGPSGISVDLKGNVYIADQLNQRIRELTPLGIINTIAGATHYAGDGGPATSALIHRPEQAITDSEGNLYISDTDNNVVRKVDTKGVITTVAGSGNCNYGGDLGKATSASLCYPEGLAFDAGGNLFIADWGNCVVRRIDATGIITTIAGNQTCADTASPGTATNVSFLGPYGLAFDANGYLYISDNISNRVSVVLFGQSNPSANGARIQLFAGNGAAAMTGDGGLSSSAALNGPGGIASGPNGTIYIADTGNSRIRKVVTTSAGNPGIIGTVSIAAPKGLTFASPDGIAVDSSGDLFVSWEGSQLVTKTAPSGATGIIAGTGMSGFSGDNGLAPSALLSGPSGLSQDASGSLYLADLLNNRIRKLTPDNPTGMNLASGDGQSGATGTALPLPVVVALTFQGGVGIPGIAVNFAVTSGSASVSVPSTTTDGSGNAGVAVTLGNTPGPVIVTASAAGLPSVQFHLTAISTVPLPTITTGGIIGAGGSTPPVTDLSAGGFATIFGQNFAPAGTFATAPAGAWPTQLGGVCVTVNGAAAFVTFASPAQINFQVPDIPANTTVTVQVLSNCGTPNELQSAVQSLATAAATPEFLYWLKNANGTDPVVAVDSITGAYIGATGLIAGATFTPAKPGEIVTIYGVSFGPTDPAAIPGTPPSAAAKSIYMAAVKLGTIALDPTAVLYAGVSPGTAGLYQLNIRIPSPIADGDYPLILSLGTFATPAGGFITVRN